MGLDFKPHPYQERAIQHILDNPECGLFLDMGLGKTAITLTAIAEFMYDRFECKKTLVVAPKRVAETVWAQEIEKWNHTEFLTASLVAGNEKKRVRALFKNADIYILGRDNVEWLVNFYGKHFPFDALVIDELSSFKSPSARRFRALRKVRPYFTRVIGLTGTPAPNGLLDLWPQLYLLDMGERLGTRVTSYREQYFEPDRKGWVNGQPRVYSYVPKLGAEDTIYRKIADICVSMSAKDYLDLKEPFHHTVEVQLPREASRRYAQLEHDLLLPFDQGDVVATTAATLSNKLLQMAGGAVYDEDGNSLEVHDAKIEALEDLVEAANGQPLLVYYGFRHDIPRIKRKFPQAVEFKTARDAERWNNGQIPMLLAHPASAGHGLNLQHGGNTIVWYSAPWSLELYLQANARLQRQGQTKQVVIYHLVAKGTLDEDVMVSLDNKEDGQEALLNAVKARISKVQDKVSEKR